MTTCWSRSRLQHLRFCGNGMMRHHDLVKYCWSRYDYTLGCLRHNSCPNPQFGCVVLHISSTEVDRHLPPYQLGRFVNSHLLRPKPLHVLLNNFGHSANTKQASSCFRSLTGPESSSSSSSSSLLSPLSELA